MTDRRRGPRSQQYKDKCRDGQNWHQEFIRKYLGACKKQEAKND